MRIESRDRETTNDKSEKTKARPPTSDGERAFK